MPSALTCKRCRFEGCACFFERGLCRECVKTLNEDENGERHLGCADPMHTIVEYGGERMTLHAFRSKKQNYAKAHGKRPQNLGWKPVLVKFVERPRRYYGKSSARLPIVGVK